MRHGKTTALKCLPLATELLIVFLTADILWQLLCGRPPFSMWGFLLSGGLMTAGNSLFLQKPRRFWQILLLNVLLCAVWIPLLSRTLDLTYPPLLVIQVPLYLFPLCRGYHWGVTPVTVRHLHGAGEYMGLYGLFYLIVASFAPQLLDRVPVLLALLALELLAVVGMRTSGRNTIRAGSPFGRLPALLVPAVLALLAVAACALLLAARGELIPIFQAVGSLLEGALIAVFRFLTSLFQGRSAGSAGMSSAAGGGSEAALPVESASGPAIAARWGKPAAELADNDEVWALEGDYLGQMCANLVLMYSPRRIVLGGGVMHQEQLYGIVRKKTLEYLGGYIQTAELKDMESYICAPGCGGDQGILGAAELARRALA